MFLDTEGDKSNLQKDYMLAEEENQVEAGELSEGEIAPASEKQESVVTPAPVEALDGLKLPVEAVEGLQAPVEIPGEKGQTVESDVSSDTTSDLELSSDDGEPQKPVQDDLEDDFDGPLRTKNELLMPKIEKIQIDIPEHLPLIKIGHVLHMVENTVVIGSLESGENKVLDADTILLLQDRRPFGRIFDVFGPVTRPLYSVLFNNVEEMGEYQLRVGQEIFYIHNLAKIVMTQPLKRMKGTDASNINDEELPPEEQEFSDDEMEAQFKKKKNDKKKQKRDPKPERPEPRVEYEYTQAQPSQIPLNMVQQMMLLQQMQHMQAQHQMLQQLQMAQQQVFMQPPTTYAPFQPPPQPAQTPSDQHVQDLLRQLHQPPHSQ
ncbi:Gar1/Naf1 RNA binding region-domain-containing protein [Gorgonomyces haynaldii]|nr:Gar1/Naf1 RNA binding region-domain-containing protein [Gorgonomyces haynaldii]